MRCQFLLFLLFLSISLTKVQGQSCSDFGATPVVVELVECDSIGRAKITVINSHGGLPPYMYSFDGGDPSEVATGYLLPGEHSIGMTDSQGCFFTMNVTIEEPSNPELTAAITYDCEGKGTATITAGQPNFDHTYAIDGLPSQLSNVFTDISAGLHTIKVESTNKEPPNLSKLFLQDFGKGKNVTIDQISDKYCWESQLVGTVDCDSLNSTINDGEYSVTSKILSPFGPWRSPNDHSVAGGRFLAINIGDVVGEGDVIYRERDVKVFAYRKIEASLWAFNLLKDSVSVEGTDPELTIQLVDPLGNVIDSVGTGQIPKNKHLDDWHNYKVTLNPGLHTSLDIVVRTKSTEIAGNDVALDDIQAFQLPKVCTISEEIVIITEPSPILVSDTTQEETCTGDKNGTAKITISGGTPPYSTSIDSNDPADYVLNKKSFSGLSFGSHIIYVKDAKGCESNITVQIKAGVDLSNTVTPIYDYCGTELFINSIDVVLQDSTIKNVLYGLNTTNVALMQLKPDFVNILPGKHYLYILHANGCAETTLFKIEDFAPLSLVVKNSDMNEITAVASGGASNYTFYVNGRHSGKDNILKIEKTGTYEILVTDDKGCEMTQSIFVEFIELELPKYFTPNGDFVNEKWKPKNTGRFSNLLCIIYDRYGRELYRMGKNDSGWNGFNRNKQMPSGDYWYTLKLKGEEDLQEFTGHFSLVR